MKSLVLVLIASLACILIASAEPKAEMTGSGTYKVNVPEQGKGSESSTGFANKIDPSGIRLVEEGNDIEGRLGYSFGFRYRLKEGAEYRRTLGIRWVHPTMTNPDTGETLEQQDFREIVPAGATDGVVFYTFNHPWEIVEGTWTATLVDQDGYPILRERYEVTRARF